MTEMSRRFNFDDFDELCREALDSRMAQEDIDWEEEQRWIEYGPLPGEIGGVACSPTLDFPLSDPAEPV